jgi:hypothetical protein
MKKQYVNVANHAYGRCFAFLVDISFRLHTTWLPQKMTKESPVQPTQLFKQYMDL